MVKNANENMERIFGQLEMQGSAIVEGTAGCGKNALLKERLNMHYPNQQVMEVNSTHKLSVHPVLEHGKIIQKNPLLNVDVLIIEETQFLPIEELEAVFSFIYSGKKVIFLLNDLIDTETLYKLFVDHDFVFDPVHVESIC